LSPRSRSLSSVPERTINLTFHGIGEPSRPLDQDEHRLWLDPDQFEMVLDSVVGRTDCRLTFDDGNASDVEHALPHLRRRNLTATFFVVAGRLGEHGFLDESGVRELVDAGMEVGCHGMRHRPWRELDDAELAEELDDARRVLERVTGRPVTEAACPFGSYDRRVLRSLRDHGYRRAYTSDTGTTDPGDWIQSRNTVTPENATGLVERVLHAERSVFTVLRRRALQAVKRWR